MDEASACSNGEKRRTVITLSHSKQPFAKQPFACRFLRQARCGFIDRCS
jgi:hypothetical protein